MAYKTPEPPVHIFSDPRQQNFFRRIYERLTNLERATNLQSFEDGRKAPAPPQADLKVTTHPNAPGVFTVHIANPEFQVNARNKMGSPVRHWLQASPDPAFRKNVTNFPVTHQTHFSINELGAGKFHFRLRSTFDGKTFNNPVQRSARIAGGGSSQILGSSPALASGAGMAAGTAAGTAAGSGALPAATLSALTTEYVLGSSPPPPVTTHSEPLTDGAGNFIFMGGDIIVCTGVPD